jgi:DNA topoisomerase-1
MRSFGKARSYGRPSGVEVDVLVVCEKNSVAKAVASALSDDYKTLSVNEVPCYSFVKDGKKWVVMGLKGHLMDFDFDAKLNQWGSVDPKELFKASPVRVFREESLRYVDALRELARRAEEVVLGAGRRRGG